MAAHLLDEPPQLLVVRHALAPLGVLVQTSAAYTTNRPTAIVGRRTSMSSTAAVSVVSG